MDCHLTCVNCGLEYEPDDAVYLCSHCGMQEVDGICTYIGLLQVSYDLQAISKKINRQVLKNRRPGLRKYSELLPVRDESTFVTLGEGGTPLIKAKLLAKEFGLEHLYLKNESTAPTGCF